METINDKNNENSESGSAQDELGKITSKPSADVSPRVLEEGLKVNGTPSRTLEYSKDNNINNDGE